MAARKKVAAKKKAAVKKRVTKAATTLKTEPVQRKPRKQKFDIETALMQLSEKVDKIAENLQLIVRGKAPENGHDSAEVPEQPQQDNFDVMYFYHDHTGTTSKAPSETAAPYASGQLVQAAAAHTDAEASIGFEPIKDVNDLRKRVGAIMLELGPHSVEIGNIISSFPSAKGGKAIGYNDLDPTQYDAFYHKVEELLSRVRAEQNV